MLQSQSLSHAQGLLGGMHGPRASQVSASPTRTPESGSLTSSGGQVEPPLPHSPCAAAVRGPEASVTRPQPLQLQHAAQHIGPQLLQSNKENSRGAPPRPAAAPSHMHDSSLAALLKSLQSCSQCGTKPQQAKHPQLSHNRKRAHAAKDGTAQKYTQRPASKAPRSRKVPRTTEGNQAAASSMLGAVGIARSVIGLTCTAAGHGCQYEKVASTVEIQSRQHTTKAVPSEYTAIAASNSQ